MSIISFVSLCRAPFSRSGIYLYKEERCGESLGGQPVPQSRVERLSTVRARLTLRIFSIDIDNEGRRVLHRGIFIEFGKANPMEIDTIESMARL